MYFGFSCTQVPHTYSVSQLLPSHVYLSSNRHRRSAQIDVYTLGFEIRQVLCCQRVPNCCNDAGILDSAPRRYHTHIRSPNYCHHICICPGIGTKKALKNWFIHTVSTFHCFYAVNVCQTVSMMKVLWIVLYTGTPHIFGLPTTAIACSFVKE